MRPSVRLSRAARAGRAGQAAGPGRTAAALCCAVSLAFLLGACGPAHSATHAAGSAQPDGPGSARAGGRTAPPTFTTWEKEGKSVNPSFRYPAKAMAEGDPLFPWAGTVSHHFLTDPLIDSWFKEISERREVRHFFILSPSHFGLSTRDYSVASGRWDCGDGYVYTNAGYAGRMCASLGVDFDDQVFPDEHGVSTLIPYIRRYFPGADVVAVAVQGEPPMNMDYCRRLLGAVAPFFDGEGRKENFLVVSSDFSHHGDPAQTALKDGISQTFFDDPRPENFIAAVCDNRPSVYVLAQLLGGGARSYVLYHTDSFTISGMDGDDITSYFFSLFG